MTYTAEQTSTRFAHQIHAGTVIRLRGEWMEISAVQYGARDVIFTFTNGTKDMFSLGHCFTTKEGN